MTRRSTYIVYFKPGQRIPYQRRNGSTLIWLIDEGIATIRVNLCTTTPWVYNTITLKAGDVHVVNKGCWHQVSNEDPTKELVLYEILFGESHDVNIIKDQFELDLIREKMYGTIHHGEVE